VGNDAPLEAGELSKQIIFKGKRVNTPTYTYLYTYHRNKEKPVLAIIQLLPLSEIVHPVSSGSTRYCLKV